MAIQVPKTPNLPRLPEKAQQALVKSLYRILTEFATRLNVAIPNDGTEGMVGPLPMAASTVSELSSLWPAASYAGAVLYCTDETGGATLVFSDGTNWRRVQDYAIAS